MDIWRSPGLGHRSVPSLWGTSQRSGRAEYALGDVRQVPKSVQVFNACVFDKIREKSKDCGLGLVAPPEMGPGASADAQVAPEQAPEQAGKASHAKPSLRSHAASRLERQKRTHDVIESTTDVKRLLWEAQAAFSAHQYTLAAVLYRRAAELGNDYACAFLAKLFGFGVVRANQSLFLFERDSLRGIAWGILAFERITQQMQKLSSHTADYAAQLSLLNQTLTLLCTLLCSPEACQALATDESQADISFSLLLLFPRSCEVYTARPSHDLQHAEDARRSIWTALQDALHNAQPLFIMPSDADEPTDSVQLESAKALARTHAAFLEAFLAMRAAFMDKSTASVDAVYQAWLAYLETASACPDSASLMRYRRVAAEGQQWSAPTSERNINAVLSAAEHSALSKRISSIFPFASASKDQRRGSSSALQDVNNLLRQPAPPGFSRTGSSMGRTPARGPSGPALLKRPSIAPVVSTASSESITAQSSGRYMGASSTLRSMSERQVSREASQASVGARPWSRRPSVSSVASTSTTDTPSYLDRMRDEVPTFSRRRTSSIVSVSPSLMFPVKSNELPEAVLYDEPATTAATQVPPMERSNTMQDLRARLRRQASTASLHTLGG